MEHIGFLRAEYLPYVLCAAFFIFALLFSAIWRRNSSLHQRSNRNIGRIFSTLRLLLGALTASLAGLFLGFLLLHPYLKIREKRTIYEPVDIVIADDKSLSILAQATSDECGPSRLDVGKKEVGKFIDMVERRKSDRLGLVVFARFGYRYVPALTKDYDFFRRMWRDIGEDELQAGGLLGGTNHWDAVIEATKTFSTSKSRNKRVLIIMTDGEPDAPDEVLKKSKAGALTAINDLGQIAIYVVGVGDPRSRYPIPKARNRYGCPVEFYRQTAGEDVDKIILTQPDAVELQDLAKNLGGRYIHSRTGQNLSEIMSEILEKERRASGFEIVNATHDLTKQFILITLGLLAVMVIFKTP